MPGPHRPSCPPEDDVTTAWMIGLPTAGAIVAAYLIRRALLWMAGRGWIFYGDSPRPRGSGAVAAMEIAAMLEPEVRHVVEEIRSERVRSDQAESGDDF